MDAVTGIRTSIAVAAIMPVLMRDAILHFIVPLRFPDNFQNNFTQGHTTGAYIWFYIFCFSPHLAADALHSDHTIPPDTRFTVPRLRPTAPSVDELKVDARYVVSFSVGDRFNVEYFGIKPVRILRFKYISVIVPVGARADYIGTCRQVCKRIGE